MLEGLHSSTNGLSTALSGSQDLRVDVSPGRDAPFKLRNGTLVRPAERTMPMNKALAPMRAPNRSYHAYVRYLDLLQMSDAVRGALPLAPCVSRLEPH